MLLNKTFACPICCTVFGDERYVRDCQSVGRFKQDFQKKLAKHKILFFACETEDLSFFLPIKDFYIQQIGKSCLRNRLVIEGFCPNPNFLERIQIENSESVISFNQREISADLFYKSFEIFDVSVAVQMGFEVLAAYDWERYASDEVKKDYIKALRQKTRQLTSIQRDILNNQTFPGSIGLHQTIVSLGDFPTL